MFPKPTRIKDKKAIKAARLPYCEICGNTWMIEIHHIKSRGAGGHDIPENLMCLCRDCHRAVHDGNISRVELMRIKEGN